jgi:hypothetical protein
MTIKVTYNVTDVYVTQDVSPVYINVSYSSGGGGGAAVWGGITGTLSDQTDLQTALDGKFDDPTGTTSQYLRGDGSLATFPSLTGYVPYTGATGDVNLGTHRILAQNATIASSGSGDTVSLTHSSGSGIGLNITKGGNGEGLYINKTGGSGNAATIIGTINATTLVKSGGTSSQFLKADGTVDSSVYVPTSREITINGVTYDLSANRSWTVSGGISGSGSSGQVAYWTGASAQAGSNNLFWDNANGRLGIGTNAPSSPLHIVSSALVTALYVNTGNDGGFTTQNNGTLSVNRTTQVRLVNGSTIFGANDRTYQLVNIGKNSTEADFYIQYWNGVNYLDRFRLFSTGNLGIGTGATDSGQRLQVQGTSFFGGNMTLNLNQNGATLSTVSNTTNGTNSLAALQAISNGNGTTEVGKFSQLKTANKTIASGDGYLYNNIYGDISILNDVATGNIKFAAGGVSTAHMTLHNTGNLLLGSTTNSGERLQVTGNVKVTGASTFGGNMILNLSQNGNTKFELFNTTNGSASETSLVLTSSNGLFLFSKYSASKTAYKFVSSGDALMYNATNGNISILNDFGTGTIKFGAGGSSTAHMTIKANGTINMSSLPTSPTGLSSGDLWNNLGMINIV